jgi:GNAT superfamily N-acetyltransferase
VPSIEYLRFEAEVPRADLSAVWALHQAVFESGVTDSEFRDRVGAMPGLISLIARRGAETVGFKIGYRRSNEEFYSWLGCVAPDARGAGIATELMRRQHERARELGYQWVVTETKNRWRGMLILNLRHGFDVVGTYVNRRGETVIMLAKTLGSP